MTALQHGPVRPGAMRSVPRMALGQPGFAAGRASGISEKHKYRHDFLASSKPRTLLREMRPLILVCAGAIAVPIAINFYFSHWNP